MAVEDDLFLSSGSFFLLGYRYRLDIRVGMKINLVSMMGSKLTCFFVGGVGIELVSVSVSNLTSLCGGQIRVHFCVRAKN